MKNHTPTPWYQGYDTKNNEKTVFGHDEHKNNGIPVVFCDRGSSDIDIHYIVHCVNGHDDLIKLLKICLDLYVPENTPLEKEIKQTLKKAGE